MAKMHETQGQKQAAENPRIEEEETQPGTGMGSGDQGAPAPLFSRMFAKASMSSKLSREGQEYRESLKEALTDEQTGLQVYPETTRSAEGMMVYNDEKLAILLIFSESLTTAQETLSPVVCSRELLEIMNDVVSKDGDGNPVYRFTVTNIITVSKEDYETLPQMINYLSNTLKDDMKEARNINLKSFGNSQIVVDTDVNNVRNFISQLSPHGVPPRCDFGALLEIDEGGKFQQGLNQENERYPFLAVAGYTEFIQANMNMLTPTQIQQGENMKYIPLAKISEIVSPIPMPNLLGIALPVAAQAFIRNNGWIQPYGFGKNDLNLGNLVVDRESGQMWHCENRRQRDELIMKYMTNPFLAIDAQLGRGQLFGMQWIHRNPVVVVEYLRKFLDTDDALPTPRGEAMIGPDEIRKYHNNEPVPFNGSNLPIWNMLGGSVTMNRQKRDIREVDYLNLARSYKDPSAIQHLLEKSQDPYQRFNEIKSMFPDAKAEYTGAEMVLDASFVDSICGCLDKAVRAGKLNLRFLQEVTQMDSSVKNLLNSNANQFQAGLESTNMGGGSPFIQPPNVGTFF